MATRLSLHLHTLREGSAATLRMNNIPKKLREEMAADPYYTRCARADLLQDHICRPDPLTGKLIEWEHALIFAGRQVQRKFAIVPICWQVHRGPELVKEINVWIALTRATDEELREISTAVDYLQEKKRLNEKYADKENQPILQTIGF